MQSFFTTYKPSFSKALKLALPIIAGQLGHILMGFFDTVQIGGLGPDYIAAAGLANTIYWLLTLLGLGVLFSISPLVSEAFGEQKPEKSIGIYRSSMTVAAVIAILFTGVVYLATVFFEVFQQPPHVAALSKRYLLVVNLGTPFMMLFTAGRQLLDGMGRTMLGMIINIAALVLNVFLNWLLIYGHWGLPALGIEGAALATAISRFAMMATVMLIIRYDVEIKTLWAAYKASTFNSESFIKPVLTIGIPASIQVFAEAAAFSVAHIMCGWLGGLELAAHQIAINMASITFMTITGISAAGTILTGYAYGAKDKEGIRISGNTVIMLVIGLELVFMVMFWACHNLLPALYTNDAAVMAMASTLLLFAIGFQVVDGLQNVAVGILRGIQDVRVPAILAFTSYWGVMIPACYLLAFKYGFGVSGIWIGFIMGLSTAATVLLLRYRYKVRVAV